MILVSQGWPQGCAQPYFYILDELRVPSQFRYLCITYCSKIQSAQLIPIVSCWMAFLFMNCNTFSRMFRIFAP